MLLTLTCFLVVVLVLKAFRLPAWLGALIAAGVTIALKPYLAGIEIGSGTTWGIWVSITLLLLPYYLGPFLVHATQRASADPTFEPYDPALHRVPDSIGTGIREATESLRSIGFQQVGDVFQKGHTPGMATRVALLEKASTGQQAICVGMYIDAEHTKTIANHVEIGCSFSDERSVLVNNSAVIGVYGRVRGKIVERFPLVRDAARLALIHEKLVEQARGETAIVPRDISKTLPEYLAGMMRKEMEQQVPLGYLRLDTAANAYRPTWKGAVLMCWKLLPPVSTIRLALSRRRSAALLARLGLTGIDANPASVPAVKVALHQRYSWVMIALIGLFVAYVGGADTRPAGALEAPPASVVPADFEVPNDFPGAVRALETLAVATAAPLYVRDSLGERVKTSGASVGVAADLADSIIASTQRAFLARGFFLFRHEPNYGLNGRPDEIALVPVWDQYRVVKLVGTNGANFGIGNGDVIAWLRELEKDAPFVLIGVGFDHVEARFTSPVADPHAMAARLYKFCPDIVHQGTGSVAELASELRRLNTFFCWWD